jgi:UDP-glucose 4-epimerase
MNDIETKVAREYKRAVVTGGAGFIGSHLIDALLGIGLEVVCIDDFSAGKPINIAHNLANSRFTPVDADVSRIEEIRPHFAGADIVFHQACSKNTICMHDPARDLAVNATGTLNVLLCAKEAGAKRVVHASTGSVYGEPKKFPTDENHELAPVSYYGVSKLAGEKYAILFNTLHGRDVVALRYFHVFGPRQDNSDVGGVVSIFCRRAHQGADLIIYGDGTQVRSFTYVGDVVRINLLAAVHPDMPGRAFNCASGVRITIKELADRVIAHYGNKVGIDYADWKAGDIRNFNVDNGLLRSMGFAFQKDFDAGLQETLGWTSRFIAAGAA